MGTSRMLLVYCTAAITSNVFSYRFAGHEGPALLHTCGTGRRPNLLLVALLLADSIRHLPSALPGRSWGC
eukprot:scaffold1073_cov383-Prasinococcus_capsulatus_cf.AAC.10